MPKVNPKIETFARIKVIGTGGSGGNVINHMINSKVTGVEYIAMNTDTQDLHASKADTKIHIGKNLTRGLGSGMNPELGRSAAEETKAEIVEAIKGADMVFIAAGMGGGTGTGAAPIIAQTAKEEGILTIAVVTKPFGFEGQKRANIAQEGIEALEKEVDAIITIPNDRLLEIAGEDMKLTDSFALVDDVLKQAVESISELITTPGLINIDHADIKAILSNAGTAFMGIGSATGEKRAHDAVIEAITSPLLNTEIHGARGVLFAISGSDDMTMNEINEISTTINKSIDPDARVIMGTILDNSLKVGEIKVTVIATGLESTNTRNKAVVSNLRREEQEEKPIQNNSKRDSDEIEEIEEIDDEDDWSAVPSFLRKGKK